MKDFLELAARTLGNVRPMSQTASGLILSAPGAVFDASEFVRARAHMEAALPTGSIMLVNYDLLEEDRYGNRLIEGVTLYVLLPHHHK